MADALYSITLKVNGKTVQAEVPAELRLLDFIRNNLNLTGAKEVCGEGECGACTIIFDGKTVNACLILAVEAHEAEIVTIEGLSDGKVLTEMQQAFVDHHSVQCGYCIPGMVLSGEQIIKDHGQPDRETIKEDLSGNICRCTGYQKIVDAIEFAAGILDTNYTNKTNEHEGNKKLHRVSKDTEKNLCDPQRSWRLKSE